MSNDIVRGALYLLLGECLLAVMAAIIKYVSSDVPQETLVFIRNLFGLIALTPIIARVGWQQLKTKQLPLHLVRAITGLSAMYCYFYVIGHMPLAEAILVKLTVPFLLPIVAFLWLKERINNITFWSIIIGFIGVVFVLRPGAENFQPVALIGLAAAALATIAKVSIRRMSASEPSHRIVFYFGFLATLISAIPLSWGWQTPSNGMWIWLVLIGIAGTAGQLFMTQAYLIAKPGQVGPYTYSAVLYASLIGYFIWGEVLLWTTLVGTALIVFAGLINMKKGNE